MTSPSSSDYDEDDWITGPQHMNGCGACPAPRQEFDPDGATREQWHALAVAMKKHQQGAQTFWFRNGRAYMEFCRDHWAEVKTWLLGDAKPAPVPTMKTLEAFA